MDGTAPIEPRFHHGTGDLRAVDDRAANILSISRLSPSLTVVRPRTCSAPPTISSGA
jgi:hypothetical protein